MGLSGSQGSIETKRTNSLLKGALGPKQVSPTVADLLLTLSPFKMEQGGPIMEAVQSNPVHTESYLERGKAGTGGGNICVLRQPGAQTAVDSHDSTGQFKIMVVKRAQPG